MTSRHRIVGISFDHMHMGDLLRLVQQHPRAEVVGVWHEHREKPAEVLGRLGMDEDLIFTDWRACLEKTRPTLAILCSSTGTHGEWGLRLADYGLDTLVEKPFAASLAEADAMIRAYEKQKRRLAINWPLAWYPSHRTAYRLIQEQRIGDVINIHFYDGNRGPAHHLMDKIEVTGEALLREKQQSWFYRKSAGGGSLLDYLGYGTTLATWFNGGQEPHEVMTMVDEPAGVEVDEHSITLAKYASGLSKFETRWGTFSDPWTHQPQPKCGFVICGTTGTISSYDFEPHVRLQTRLSPQGEEVPVDPLQAPCCDPVTYVLDCIENDRNIEGPLSPATCRIGQRIVDAAVRSSKEKRSVLY
jgi:predicted dehydrogenase